MALYTIADLHLSAGVQKPMDIFGGKWQGYMDKIQKNWRAVIQPEDTLLIPAQIHDETIFRRELLRLEHSFQAAQAQGAEEIYCFLHYPPVFTSFRCGEIIDLMHRYQVEQCIYGHLHSDSLRYAVTGIHEGINFRLVSGDYIDNMTVLLIK